MKKNAGIFSFFLLVFPFFISASTLGDIEPFFISEEYDISGRSQINARLTDISERANWYVAEDYWQSISQQEREAFLFRIQQLKFEFDQKIYPIETAFWGQEPNPGIDGDSKITIVFTKLVEKAGGLFDSGNLYSKSQTENSNQREMIYLNISSVWNNKAKVFLAHEFQHIISFNQKTILRKLFEDLWLNEAFSEYSITKVGYDDQFNGSNLHRRFLSFKDSPSNPLGEWKNDESDYGTARMFVQYFIEQISDKVFVDAMQSLNIGITSLNQALVKNGESRNFNRIFADWAVTNYINDPSNSRYSYKIRELNNFRVPPTHVVAISGLPQFTISGFVKDWQPQWYRFLTSGISGDLKISFSSESGSNFTIPVIIELVNGQKQIKFLPIISNVIDVGLKNNGDINAITVIPILTSKTTDFSDNDIGKSFSIRIVPLVEQSLPALSDEPVVKLVDGSLISFNGESYIVKGNWLRPMSKEALGLYGHLSNAVSINVTGALFRTYKVSNYIRPANSQKIYAVWPDNTKHWFNMSGEYFLSSGRLFDAVYVVNELESGFYKDGSHIIR